MEGGGGGKGGEGERGKGGRGRGEEGSYSSCKLIGHITSLQQNYLTKLSQLNICHVGDLSQRVYC